MAERSEAPPTQVTVEEIERVLRYIPGISCWCRGDCLDRRRCWAEHLAAGGKPPEEYLNAVREGKPNVQS